MRFITPAPRQSVTALATALLLLLVTVPLLSAAVREEPVALTGRVEDCFRGSPHAVAGMEMTAFGPAASRVLVRALTDLQAASSGPQSPRGEAYESKYRALVDLLQSLGALARDTTDNDGTFTLSMRTRDTVLVVGRNTLSNELHHSYLFVSTRAHTVLVLDMARGRCVPRVRRSDGSRFSV